MSLIWFSSAQLVSCLLVGLLSFCHLTEPNVAAFTDVTVNIRGSGFRAWTRIHPAVTQAGLRWTLNRVHHAGGRRAVLQPVASPCKLMKDLFDNTIRSTETVHWESCKLLVQHGLQLIRRTSFAFLFRCVKVQTVLSAWRWLTPAGHLGVCRSYDMFVCRPAWACCWSFSLLSK